MRVALLSALVLVGCLGQTRTGVYAGAPAAPINVILWFDTEDYILPRSDDAARRLAEILTRLGVSGTFKIVGEKARVLEQRGRTDVIEALRKHEIGYHTDMHSRQPTVSVYLQHSGWDDGAAEFLRREGPGLRDVERIFGVLPVCYGQPGSSWAPQVYPALARLGVRVYLDEAGHVGLDDQPFYYCGMLHIFNMRSACTRMELTGTDNLSKGKAEFRKASDALRARGGGTLSIYYHPCEFVHGEFWDGLNFSHGANPPRNDWKVPPTRPEPDIEKSFSDFEKYIAFIRDEPGVRFVRAAELLERYADETYTRIFTRTEVVQLAEATAAEISFRKSGEEMLSGADIFSLLTSAVVALADHSDIPEGLQAVRLYGPGRAFAPGAGPPPPTTVPWPAFASAALDTAAYCRAHARMPDEIWIGANAIPPEDFLATCAAVVRLASGGPIPGLIEIRKARLASEKYVARDSAGLWDWVIFPPGFHAPDLMQLARLQAWTLKPALLR